MEFENKKGVYHKSTLCSLGILSGKATCDFSPERFSEGPNPIVLEKNKSPQFDAIKLPPTVRLSVTHHSL